METYAVLREAFLSGETGSVGRISAFKKAVTGRVIPKSERERLEIFERMLSWDAGTGGAADRACRDRLLPEFRADGKRM